MKRAAFVCVLLLFTTAVAGCAEDEPVQSQQPHTRAFAVEGETRAAACAITIVAGSCFFPDGDTLHQLPSRGTPLRLEGRLSWDAAGPATEELQVLLLRRSDDGWTWDERMPRAEGTSPLDIDFPLRHWAAVGLALYVDGLQWTSAGVAAAGTSVPQDYAFDGGLTTL